MKFLAHARACLIAQSTKCWDRWDDLMLCAGSCPQRQQRLPAQGHRLSPAAPPLRGHRAVVATNPAVTTDAGSPEVPAQLPISPRAPPAHLAPEGRPQEAQDGGRGRGSTGHYHADTATEARLLKHQKMKSEIHHGSGQMAKTRRISHAELAENGPASAPSRADSAVLWKCELTLNLASGIKSQLNLKTSNSALQAELMPKTQLLLCQILPALGASIQRSPFLREMTFQYL